MVVIAARFELRLRDVASLKEKRSRVRPIVERIRVRHHLSVSEVDHQDDLHLATVGVAVVAPTAKRATELMDGVDRLVWAADGVEVIEAVRSWVTEDD